MSNYKFKAIDMHTTDNVKCIVKRGKIHQLKYSSEFFIFHFACSVNKCGCGTLPDSFPNPPPCPFTATTQIYFLITK